MVSDRFKGKELWKTINICFFFGAYTSMFIIPLFFPDLIVTLFIILAFLAISYIAIQQAIFRKMELKNAGRRVLSGWIDEEEDLGEEYEIPIKKITPFNRLSEDDKKAVDAFMESETKKLKENGLQGINLLERKILESERKIEKRTKIPTIIIKIIHATVFFSIFSGALCLESFWNLVNSSAEEIGDPDKTVRFKSEYNL